MKDIEQLIKELLQQISLNELSNDGYYLSRQYKEDYTTLQTLRSYQLKQHSKNNLPKK